jgi:hypothetical protein
MANEKKFIVTRDLSVERGEVLSGFGHFLFIATDALSEIVEQPIQELQPNDAWTTGTVIGGVRSDYWRKATIPIAKPTVVELPKVGVECRRYAMGSVFKYVNDDYDLIWDSESEYYTAANKLKLTRRGYQGACHCLCSDLILISEPTVVELPKVGVECREYAMHSVFKHAKYDLLWGVNSDYYPERGGYRDALKLYWEGHGTYNYLPCSELTLISEPTVKDCLTVEQPIELSDIVGPTYSLDTAEFDEQPKAINTEWLALYACILYASEEVSKESAIEDAIENASNIYKLVIQRVKDSAVELQQDKE